MDDRGGKLVLSSAVLHLGGLPTQALLIGTNLALVFGGILFGCSTVASRREAQRQVEIQAWHLRQLLP